MTPTTLRYVEKGLKVHTGFGMSLYLGSMHNTLSMVHMNLGNVEKALVHARQAVDLSRSNNERHFEAESKIVLGRVTAATDRTKFDEARGLIRQGMRMFDELQIRPRYAVALLSLGELYADAGQRETAIENLRIAEGMFLEMGMDFWLCKAREVLGAV